jgi:H/ACA ribonucleoprotein complex subunit 4
MEKIIELGADRKIEDLLRTGVINLDKPMGPTSHQVSSWVKIMFNLTKVGHGGTLDPRVTGVLPIGLEASSKILHVLTYSSKKYLGVMRLHGDITLKKVQRTAAEFVGPIYQFPPLRSAVKRQLRIRTIYSLDIIEQNGRDVLFSATCQAGTYIRSLVHDLGLVLGPGAHMQELRRLRTGMFHDRDAITLHELKDATVYWQEEKDDTKLKNSILPKEVLLLDLPKIVIQDSAVDAICHGAPLAIPGVISFEDIRYSGEPVAMFSRKGEGVAIGEAQLLGNEILNSKSGIVAKTSRVLMPTGTYQKSWKTKEK